jgi:basic membrane protein A
MKKVISLLLAVTMIFSLSACSQKSDTPDSTTETPNDETTAEETPAEPYKAALLLNGTLGDKSFFDSANSGLQKLKDELGADVFDFDVEEMGATPADETKWAPTMLDYCDTGEYDVIIVGTWQMIDALKDAATQFPDQKFIFFDETFDYSAGEFDNIYNVLYKQNEVSFLVGAAAALMTTDSSLPMVDPSNKNIGFLGGMENPIINDFLLGYIQGAKYVEPEVKVAIGYVGNFYDSAAGKDIALVQYQSGGVDVGFNVAGGAGLGQIEAAVDAKKYAFGVDSDQAALLPEKAEYIPTSALKNVGNSLERAIKLDLDGKLEYGVAEKLGFAEGGVEIVKDEHYEEMIPESIRTKLDELQQEIIDGTIVVDTAIGKTQEEIEAIKASVQ